MVTITSFRRVPPNDRTPVLPTMVACLPRQLTGPKISALASAAVLPGVVTFTSGLQHPPATRTRPPGSGATSAAPRGTDIEPMPTVLNFLVTGLNTSALERVFRLER